LNDRRNHRRVLERDTQDSDHLGKYLPRSPELVINDIVEGPDDAFVPPSWLLEAVREVALSSSETPKMPPVRFGTDQASLEHNAELLGQFDFDLSELLDHLADTTLGYSSEFRPVSQLQKITNFSFFRTVLQKRMSYMFSSEIPDDVRRNELAGQMARETTSPRPQIQMWPKRP
jgi:hypothetical protein